MSIFGSKQALLAGAALAVLGAPIAFAAGNAQSAAPAPSQQASPAPSPSPTPPSATPAPSPAETAAPKGDGEEQGGGEASAPSASNARLPTLEELESLDTDELDELLGLKPKYDIPKAQRRETTRVGILDEAEGGLPAASLAKQPQALVRAALTGTQGRLVSRWGHIALRRALASRLAAPSGMSGVEFAGLRAQLLNRMGEFSAARAIAQDVDVDVWNARLSNAAIDAYIATGDIVGACPLTMLRAGYRDDVEWQMLRSICSAYAGEAARARNNLLRLRDRQSGEDGNVIDVLLAQRFAGAAGLGNSAVTIEWDDVDELTPWRYGLAAALGIDIPDRLIDDAGPYYQRVSASLPALPLSQRVEGVRRAAREGIFSSSALIDVYAQGYAASREEGPLGTDAALLRAAYVDPDPAARVTAIRTLWGDAETIPYDRQVLTAYAAARIPANDGFAADAGGAGQIKHDAEHQRPGEGADEADARMHRHGGALIALRRSGDDTGGDRRRIAGEGNAVKQ